jgi:hypothetical protein
VADAIDELEFWILDLGHFEKELVAERHSHHGHLSGFLSAHHDRGHARLASLVAPCAGGWAALRELYKCLP